MLERIKNTKKNKKNDSYDNVNLLNNYFKVIISLALFSVLISFLTHFRILFYPPEGIQSGGLALWSAVNVFLPYTLLFFISVFSSWFILSQESITYIKWLFKQSINNLTLNYLIYITIIIAVMTISISSFPDNAYNAINEHNNMTKPQVTLWNSMIIFMPTALWCGYREGWKSYKQIGATTTQLSYEDELMKNEIKTSGQFWDRRIMPIYNFFTGKNGEKPRGFLLFLVISVPVLVYSWIKATVFGYYYLIGISVFLVQPAILAIFMTVSKRNDMKMTKHAPRLNPVRRPGTNDDYNPGSVGVKVFNRKG